AMNLYTEANRARWNELAALHPSSPLYRTEEFRAGKNRLYPLDHEEVGDVSGMTLLHLQCHFGLDTLSWARLGAHVTGFDFSETAVSTAQALAAELNIPARFVLSTYDRLTDDLDGRFDIVYMSRGVLCWLPDLAPLFRVVAHFLKPGGFFYVADTHPVLYALDDRPGATEPTFLYSYFHRDEPDRFEVQNSYADPDARLLNTTEYVWNHPLSELVTLTLASGLQLEFLHEFPYSFFPVVPSMTADANDYWRLPAPHDGKVPLMFSLRARTPRPPTPNPGGV
ncbi:MAG: class I SAM-dependent methyltransferase, partial [Dehalococcoidia bacterium]